MSDETAAPCSLLEWDSTFFGFRVAKVVGEVMSEATGHAVLEWSQTEALRCLYFLADASCPETAGVAYELGFKMVDVRIEFGLEDLLHSVPPVSEHQLQTVQSSDVSTLQEIAREAHGDSRFFFDRRFSQRHAAELFATWIGRDCGGSADHVITVRAKGQPAGYITCNLVEGSDRGRIGLLGVAREFRGQGLGTTLVSGALKWFSAVGANKIDVVTQARNLQSQRLYQRSGFRTKVVKVWYHRWFSDGPSNG